MDQATIQNELIYEYGGRLTRITDYGIPLRAVLAGEVPPPPSGLRVDIEFEAEVHGRLAGNLRGVDYLTVHADGRMELDIKGLITTRDGAHIALSASGVALPQPRTSRSLLRENVRLFTSSAEYAWVNPLQIWATGSADPSTGDLHVQGFLPV